MTIFSRLGACAGAALLASACTTNSTLDLDTHPTGAIITEPLTKDQWVTPARLVYPDVQPDSDGCRRMASLDIQWESGAAVSYAPVLCGSGPYWTKVVSRPSGGNIDVDNRAAAARLRQLEDHRRAQIAADQQAAANLFGSLLVGMAAGAAQDTSTTQQPAHDDRRRTVNCRSNVVGTNVMTSCY